MQLTLSINPKKLAAAVMAAALVVTLAACQAGNTGSKAISAGGSAQYTGQTASITATNQMDRTTPYPAAKLTHSTELDNLAEKLARYNDPSKISYIYLLSNTGAVIAYYTVKGKVSSNASQMTPTQDVIDGCPQSYGKDADGVCPTVVDAPEDDGSYGPSEPGIFFFTTDSVMITWDGQYLLSDAPMKINPATLTLNYITGSKPTSTGGHIK